MVKEVGKCQYCGDPIYDFQEMIVIKGEKHHIGCYVDASKDGHIKLSARWSE